MLGSDRKFRNGFPTKTHVFPKGSGLLTFITTQSIVSYGNRRSTAKSPQSPAIGKSNVDMTRSVLRHFKQRRPSKMIALRVVHCNQRKSSTRRSTCCHETSLPMPGLYL